LSGAIARPAAVLADIPPRPSDAPAPEDNAEALADYTVGVFLLESGSAQAAIPYLESAWEKSSHDAMIGEKLAEAYFTAGDLARCEAVLDELLAADGDGYTTRLLKAKVAYLGSRKEEARGHLEKLEAAGEPSFEVERILATVYTDLGMKEKAVEAYGKALRLDPNYPVMYYQRGVLLRELGRLAEAEDAFENAVHLQPGFSEAAVELATIMMDGGRHAEAESVLVRSLEVNPGDYQAIEMATNIYIDQGQLDNAIRLLESENRRSTLPDEGLLLLGRLYYEVKDYEESLHIFEKMFESGGATPDLARVLGEICSKGGKTEKALGYYREAIRLGPQDYRSYLALFFGSSATFTPEASQRIDLPREEALRLLAQAAGAVSPGDADGLYLVGISYQSVDSLETAHAYLSRAGEIRPDDEHVALNLASVLEKMKRYEEAEKCLVRLHEKQPDDPTTCNFYGYLLALMGKDLGKAEGLVRKALEKDPKNGYYTDSLGWVFFMKGDYDRAVEELERATKIVGDDAVILEHLGDAYKAAKRYRDALDTYEKSKALQKENPELIRKMDAAREKAGY
jgi:tetratricopeptide (TPR) repeat protein